MSIRATLLLVLSLFFVASCKAVDPASQRENERFEAFLDEAFEQALERDPVRMGRLGIDLDQDRWTPLSDEFERETFALNRRIFTKLRGFNLDRLTDENVLNHALFSYAIQREIGWNQWRRHGYLVTQMRGPHTRVPATLMNVHRVADAGDALNYIARLEGVEALFEELTHELRAREAKGVLPPAFVFPLVLGACRNVLSGRPFEQAGEDSALLADFRAKVSALGLEEARRDDLIGRAEEALRTKVGPAYRSLIALLEEQATRATDEDGAWKLPDGAAYYAAQLKRNTTTQMSADEIHALGLSEVARIHGEMRAIQASVGFEASLQEFFEHLRVDPSFYYSNDDAGRASYLSRAGELVDEMRERLPEVFGTLPKADMIVKAVEPYRSASAGKAFYNAGTPDGSRPGIYYANLHDMADMPIYQMEALAFHEGIPGHHMQNSIARELEDVPRFRKFGGYTAYGEGWALYSEYFPKELGFYSDPYSDFGRLAMELWRACRLVVDTGLHQLQWTRQQAIDYLLENTPNPEGDCVKAIERYIVMPGQATAYKIGMNRILELRQRAIAELGQRYDPRGFHDAILRAGPVPLDILDQLVDEWIASR